MTNFGIQIKTYRPEPTDANIRSGVLPRYFVARANQLNDQAYEVSRREYGRLITNPYIVGITMNWIIRGRKEDYTVMVNTGSVLGYGGMEEVVIPGVLTQNESSVIFLSEKIPAIKKLIKSYEEFYVGDTSSGE